MENFAMPTPREQESKLYCTSGQWTQVHVQSQIYGTLWTTLRITALKHIGPKIWSDIPQFEISKSLLPYSFGNQYKKILLSSQNSCWFSFHKLVTFSQYCFQCSFPLYLYIYLYSCSTHPPVHRHAFPLYFVVVLFTYLSDIFVL